MKTFTAILVCLFIVSGLASAQNQPRSGGFAAVPAPGQPGAPAAVTPQPVAPQPPGVARPTTPTQATQQQQQQEQLRIVADPATNSLIIYGTAQEFQNIKNILKDLDAIPRQVLIEAMVLQVNYSDTENFGVDYEMFRGNRNIFDSAFGSRGALFSGAIAAFLKEGGLRGSIGGGDTVRAFVTALLKDSRVKLLSSPSVLATDNRPARIQVGTEEPVPTGTISTPTGSTGISSSTTVQYRNTGRILTIIPQVNSQGLVNLQVKAEVSQRGESVSFGGGTSAETATTFPTFDTQDAETNAVVNDGETLVIGGLIGERKSKDRKGIPYLMDIPVVGRLFGTTIDETRRTELIMLITPRVIRNRDEGRIVTDNFRNNLAAVRNELERMARDQAKLLPKPVPQQLPPMPHPNLIEPAPQPTPSNIVPGQGARLPSTGNFTGSALYHDPAQFGAVAPPVGRAEETIRVYPTPEMQHEIVAPKPQGFALSLAPVEVKPPVQIAVAKPAGSAPTVKHRRIWAVQVAAMAENKDAESMAARLRKVGHHAYVVTSQVAEKIWHRVRIGKFENQNDAQELKKDLATNKEFRQAYVALN